MPVMIEAEPFTTCQRERLALKLDDKMPVAAVLAAFDRATTEAVFHTLNGKSDELTPHQRAARTREKNRKARERTEKCEQTPEEGSLA